MCTDVLLQGEIADWTERYTAATAAAAAAATAAVEALNTARSDAAVAAALAAQRTQAALELQATGYSARIVLLQEELCAAIDDATAERCAKEQVTHHR
jgi:hypothetical protein